MLYSKALSYATTQAANVKHVLENHVASHIARHESKCDRDCECELFSLQGVVEQEVLCNSACLALVSALDAYQLMSLAHTAMAASFACFQYKEDQLAWVHQSVSNYTEVVKRKANNFYK